MIPALVEHEIDLHCFMPSPLSNVYITRVRLCDAETDDSGGVDANDVGAFAAGFVQGTPGTNLNNDGSHSGTDVERFLNAYSCGCAQQP